MFQSTQKLRESAVGRHVNKTDSLQMVGCGIAGENERGMTGCLHPFIAGPSKGALISPQEGKGLFNVFRLCNLKRV